jgi:hypothetical protein
MRSIAPPTVLPELVAIGSTYKGARRATGASLSPLFAKSPKSSRDEQSSSGNSYCPLMSFSQVTRASTWITLVSRSLSVRTTESVEATMKASFRLRGHVGGIGCPAPDSMACTSAAHARARSVANRTASATTVLYHEFTRRCALDTADTRASHRLRSDAPCCRSPALRRRSLVHFPTMLTVLGESMGARAAHRERTPTADERAMPARSPPKASHRACPMRAMNAYFSAFNLSFSAFFPSLRSCT